jgi:hypothetical protein
MALRWDFWNIYEAQIHSHVNYNQNTHADYRVRIIKTTAWIPISWHAKSNNRQLHCSCSYFNHFPIKLSNCCYIFTYHGSASFKLLAYTSSLFSPSSGVAASPSCFTIALPIITPSAPHSAICAHLKLIHKYFVNYLDVSWYNKH